MENKLELLEKLKVLQDTKVQFHNGSELFSFIKEHPEFVDLIRELSKVFLEQQLGFCESCIMDAYIRLVKFDSEAAREKVECQFRLLENALIYLDGKPITNYNLTNEKAINYLKINPDGKQWFTTTPSNLEELLSDEVNEQVENTAPVITKKKGGRPKKKK